MVDEITFIFFVWATVHSPALLALPWVWLSKLSKVKLRLKRAVKLAICGPFALTLLFLLLRTVCAQGTGIDSPFNDCGLFPAWVVVWIPLGIIVPVAGYCAYAVLRSGYEEVSNYRAHRM